MSVLTACQEMLAILVKDNSLWSTRETTINPSNQNEAYAQVSKPIIVLEFHNMFFRTKESLKPSCCYSQKANCKNHSEVVNYQGKNDIQSIAVWLRGKYGLVFILLKKMNLEVQNLIKKCSLNSILSTYLNHVTGLVQDNRY